MPPLLAKSMLALVVFLAACAPTKRAFVVSAPYVFYPPSNEQIDLYCRRLCAPGLRANETVKTCQIVELSSELANRYVAPTGEKKVLLCEIA